MKKAFSYVRISNKDQSNFSIPGQKATNQSYAEKNQVIILDEFVDDGYSAKNFDRPSWKELYSNLTKHRKNIDFLLVAKYDRLVRNAAEGLAMLKKIEEEYGIKVISTTECFFIDPHSPVFFKFRADLFVNAEFEYRVIRDRTKFGNFQARTNGRYLGTAPIGYENRRDENNKPIIIPSPDADKIRQAFSLYLKGFSFQQIKVNCRINRKGNSSIRKILTNQTYAGLIKVRAYRDHPEKIVQGMHEAIVEPEIYWAVQNKLDNSERPHTTSISSMFPLRGYLRCAECQNIMTGAESTGNGGKYPYYRCETCSRKSINARKVDSWLGEILGELAVRIPGDYWSRYFNKNASTLLKEKNSDHKRYLTELKQVESDISKLEEKYIGDKLETQVYNKWKSKYEGRREQLQTSIAESNANLTIDQNLIKSIMTRVQDLPGIYESFDVTKKQQLLKTIMIGGLYGTKGYLQTIRINRLFGSNSLKTNKLKVGSIGGIYPIFGQTPIGSPARTRTWI